MRIPRSTYRRILEEELDRAQFVLPGAAGKRFRREFVNECASAGITEDGARNEARSILVEYLADIVSAQTAAGGSALFTVWGPNGECVGVPYRVEGDKAIIERDGLPEWATAQLDALFAEHSHPRADWAMQA